MKIKHHTYLILLFAVLVNACKRDVVEPAVNFYYDYYPIEIGGYNIYQIDSIVYNLPFNKIDTFSYQTKELYESLFTDNQGRSAVRIERYYRLNSSEPWRIQNVWSVVRTTTLVDKAENNQHFVKLIFPVKENAKWNGNLYNNLGEDEYELDSLHLPFVLDGQTIDSTLIVLQEEEVNLITHKFYKEVYAKGKGLLYNEIIDLKSENIPSGNITPVIERIETGVICKKKLLEHH